MEHERVKRLPVVNQEGQLIGIVSRRDLLRPYLRPDSAIRQDVEIEVLKRTLWIIPATIEASVTDGRVTLRGRADRKSTAEIAVRLTRAVGGVVAVIDELTWARRSTRSSRLPRAPPTAPRRWRTCCTARSGWSRAS